LESVKTAPKTKKFISKRRLAYLLKLIIAAAVMIMLLKWVNISELLTAFSSANIYCISFALFLLIPNLYVQFFKWRYLVRLLKPEVSNQETFNSLLAGFTFGFVTPGRLGEFGRAFFIKDCPWVKVLGMAFMDKLFSLAVVTFWGAIGLMFFVGRQLYIYTLVPIIIFTMITLIVIYYILLRPEIIRSFLYSLNIILPFRDKIKALMSSLDNFHRKQSLNLLLLSVCFYFIFFFQFYILVCSFQPAPILQSFLAISSVMIVKSMLPISFGDLGIRESAAIFFLGKIGLLEATAFNASILLFVINLLIPSIIGLFLVLKYRLIFQKNGK
jgi:uncharacterized membrane protein YbhN (UPF0104 family)